jgi:proline dehydrogenase
MQQSGLPPGDPRVWFMQLYGMSDNLTYNLANAGYNTAALPYGPVAVMLLPAAPGRRKHAIVVQSSREFLLVQRIAGRLGC